MDPDRWKRVEDLFHLALERDAASRAAFLDEQCAGDDDLRHEVHRWLEADAGAQGRIAGVVASAVEDASGEASMAPPERIGPYRVIREIGHGGMGAVYLAERADDQFRQQVAIKLVRRVIDSPVARARFLQERQVLAQLNHPGIARLLDGGATETGLPYFAMELVAGQPLLEYCEARQLGTRERLHLFQSICAAVQYAHQNLIVHRDIKPANVLVTSDGQVKLLDFGIAKLVAERGPAAAAGTVMLLLTPDYASPEQVRGEPVTTGTDIYSLGCVLYELLCGRRPHAFTTSTPAEIERVICETEPAPPGRFRSLDEDLDTIVIKALQKDPAMRYATAEQFADDIRNYLDGRPVTARRPTLLYRGRKFAARNRIAVAAAIVALAAILIGSAAALWQARQASIQRAMAERRAQEGRRLANTVLFSVEEKIRDLSGTMDARRLIMESGVSYLDDLAKEASGDASLQLELARAYERIGDVQGTGPANLGQTDAARASFERSLALLAKLGDSTDVRKTLASVYLKHHMVLQRMAQPEPAKESLDKSIALAEPLFAADRSDADVYAVLAAGYNGRVTLESRAGNREGAIEATRHVLALTQSWAATHPGDASDLALASAHERVGVALWLAADLQSARSSLTEMIRLREQLAGRDATARTQVPLARAYNIYADVLGSPLETNFGERAEALKYYRRSLAIRDSLMTEDPTNNSAAIDVAFTLFNIAAIERQVAPARAVATMDRARTVIGRAIGLAPANLESRRSGALIDMMQASALARVGRSREALALYRNVFEVLESMHAREPNRSALRHELMIAYGERGDLLLSMKLSEDALKDYRRALALGEPIPVVKDFRLGLMTAATYERLHEYSRLAGDQRSACDWSRRAAKLWTDWHEAAPSVFSQRGLERTQATLGRCGS